MVIYVYYTPFVSSPINDRRSGTYRVGSDAPDPIQIYRGWDAIMYFAFRNHTQRIYSTIGRTITARVFNSENVEIISKNLVSDPMVDGSATLILNANQTNNIAAGLYSMIIEVEDEYGHVILAQTSTRSLPRFVVEIIDQTTIELND